MKRIFNYLLLILVAFPMFSQKVPQPDFAFPKTVMAGALKDLDKSLKDGDNDRALRALLNYSIAEFQMGDEGVRSVLSRIDSVRVSTENPVLKSLTYLLEANLYSDIYSSSKWTFDRRELPPTPLSPDCSEWSGEQFHTVITQLIDSALIEPECLRAEKLSRYSQSITQDAQTRIYFPTLYAFVANASIEILKTLTPVRQIVPYSFFEQALVPDSSGLSPALRLDPISQRIISLYSSLISVVSPASAPSINAMLGRLDYLQPFVVNPDTGSEVETSQLYLKLYKEYCDRAGKPVSEYAGDILANSPHTDEIFPIIKSFLMYYPGYWRANCLKNIITSLSEKSVAVSGPSLVPPGREISLKVNMKNTPTATIAVYDVSSLPIYQQDVTVKNQNVVGGKRIATLPVKTAKTTLPFDETVSVNFIFPAIGNYIIVPEIEGRPLRSESFMKVHASSVVLVPSRFVSSAIWAMDASTGEPLENVKLTLHTDIFSRNVKSTAAGTTDKDGFAKFGKMGNGLLTAAYNKDRFTTPVYIYDYTYSRPDKWMASAIGFSALPVYHPGDTAKWSAVCYEYKGGLRRVVSGREVKAVLYDANATPIDTIVEVPDRFGRISGEFSLPTDRMTGRYSINIDGDWNTISFEVSDYKLPSFFIKLEPVEKGVPSAGDVTLRGKITTYSGFSMGDTEVSLKLSVMSTPIWWRRSAPMSFYSTKVMTDGQGNFTITIPKEDLALSPLSRGYFEAELSATSNTGETRTAETTFTLGTRYLIKAQIPGNIDISSSKVDLDVKVVNYNDSVVDEPVILTVVRDEKTIRSGQLSRPENLDGLAPGRYTFVFSLSDPALADSVKTETVLYNPSDSLSPVPGNLFWTSDSKLSADENGNFSLLYATDADSHILLSLTSGDSLLSTRWVASPAGMSRLNLSLPDSVNDARLNILCTGDYRQETKTLSVSRVNSRKGLRIISESFRDRIVPGETETWTFRIVSLDGDGADAAVIIDLYDTALDAISVLKWDFSLREVYSPQWSWNNLPLNGTFYSAIHQNGKYSRCPSLEIAAFNTFGYSLNPVYGSGKLSGIRIRGGAPMMMMKSAANDMSDIMEDAVEEEVAEVTYDSDGGSAIAGGINESTSENAGSAAPSSPIIYRMGDQPLAFFNPMLTTDKDGRLTLTFTVPNVNTTWGFKAIAFTESLLSTTLSTDITASKPIMVDPNLPRFLREDDDVVLKASLMNNSETTKEIHSVVEIFNPANNALMLSSSRSDTLAAGASSVINVSFKVPSGISMVGYRLRSGDETNVDGEQSIIPVLSTVTPVIDASPFYMGPDEHNYQTKLPLHKENGRISLSFCENPAWYVVSALPSMIEKEALTAPEAARAIYSTALSAGLLRENPSISEALSLWSRSDKSSEVLTSMLEKNSDLKYLLLSATPWMSDAVSDTERMTKLSLYFDKDLIESTLKANIGVLEQLQTSSGGWVWSSRYPEYSSWSTLQVLNLLGQLNEMGFLPESKSLRKMIAKALVRDNEETLEQFRKYPDSDYSTYLFIHDLFLNFSEPHLSQQIADRATQRILKDWRTASIPLKARYARILYRNSYTNSAKEILSSLRELASYDSKKGMWFPQLRNDWFGSLSEVGITAGILRSFAIVEPGCREIDDLRQWLILQKGAQNWGNGTDAAEVVSAILTTSGKWFVPSQGAKISIGGKKINFSPLDNLLGETEIVIEPSQSGKSLKIQRQGDTPSWGCVYSIFKAQMTSISEASCQDLSISKAIYQVVDSTGRVITPEGALPLGSKVRVTLTVKAYTNMDYVTVIDERPACFEPVDQLSRFIYSDGLGFYLENRDSETRLFINHLPKGTYILSYDMWVNNEGTFTSGLAKIQSQYAPQFSAHSSGHLIEVK